MISADQNSDQRMVVQCLTVLREFSWLLNSFVLFCTGQDFYTQSHWSRLPQSWRDVLDGVRLEELGLWISMSDQEYTRFHNRVWPLSLQALRIAVKSFMLPRYPKEHGESQHQDSLTSSVASEDIHDMKCFKMGPTSNTSFTQFPQETTPGKPTKCLTHPKLKNLFIKHVKPKKRLEILELASLCAQAAKQSGCSYIIDVGSGKGHLSRVLAYGYGLHVCSIEAQTELSHIARKLDQEFEYTAKKQIGKEELQNLFQPIHLNMFVDLNNPTQLLEREFQTAFSIDAESDFQFGIVGLHPCGDLAASLLRLFEHCSGAKFISIVGCCYMKLTTEGVKGIGYPLSSFFHSLPRELVHQSYDALEISCHALENYCQRLKMRQYEDLKIHSYRAVVEKMIVARWPEKRHLGLRSVKHYNTLSFTKYATSVLERADLNIPVSELECQDVEDCLAQWQQVVIFYSLRLLLAPLVETAVLMDRLLFLKQQGAVCDIIPGFDPYISPRNLILMGFREQALQDTISKNKELNHPIKGHNHH